MIIIYFSREIEKAWGEWVSLRPSSTNRKSVVYPSSSKTETYLKRTNFHGNWFLLIEKFYILREAVFANWLFRNILRELVFANKHFNKLCFLYLIRHKFEKSLEVWKSILLFLRELIFGNSSQLNISINFHEIAQNLLNSRKLLLLR